MDAVNIGKDIRKEIINMAHKSKTGHVGSSMSCVDVLTVLYFDIMRLEPWDTRDIFILSKGHAAMCLYATLDVRGIIDRKLLEGYYQSTLPAHLDRFSAKGVEASAGALGHGFNVGIGMALGFKKKNNGRKVYALIGDGESQEGSIWEGALFAPTLGVDNFTAILDYNNLQGYDRPQDICAYEPVKAKWEAFGWHVIELDGHDTEALHAAFHADPGGKPKMIIAKTIKGKGVRFMEDVLGWHYYVISDKDKENALNELNR